jgi:radical SAM superfamily enzyme YgiQ (UPF0313 family)
VKKLIYLSDITYVTAEGLTSEYIPYGIGCIKSYFLKHAGSKDEVEIVLFKDPLLLRDAFLKRLPHVVAFSNYIWNSSLSLTFAKEMKKVYPQLAVVFGGPDFPLENELRTAWLRRNQWVDFYIAGEAEKPFSDLLDGFFGGRSLDHLKSSPIKGCYSLVAGEMAAQHHAFPRLFNLDLVPSPYIQGYLDEFLDHGLYIPMMQTNRGCPFSCTYCEKGTKHWTKLSRRSVEVLEEELEYIAKRSKNALLFIADNNFGMLPQDVQVAKILAKLRERYNFPSQVLAATGKGVPDNVLECASILKGTLPVTAAVQTLDPEVASNIKRTNISTEQLLFIAQSAYSLDAITRSEVILGLPGDTLEKHVNTMTQLMDAGMTFLLPYTLILLQGSELSTSISRAKWNMKTMFRLNHRCFGVYPMGPTSVHAGEIEEVVVGSVSLTFQDYLDCRTFDFTSTIFYSDEILLELLTFINRLGIKSSALIREIHFKGNAFFTEALRRLYQSFNEATHNELWEDRDELESYLKSINTIEDDQKVVGYNILFRHRALALRDLTEDIIAVAFKVAATMMDDSVLNDYADFLAQLQRYMCLKRGNIFNYEQVFEDHFDYDFRLLSDQGAPWPPVRLDKPMRMAFFHEEEQKRLFCSFPPGLTGIMRILPKLAMPKSYRHVDIISHSD